MKKQNDGGPAYPCKLYDFQPVTGEQVVRESYSGMTLLDWFAGQALKGQIAAISHPDIAVAFHRIVKNSGVDNKTYLARTSYEIADAMLIEREKQ